MNRTSDSGMGPQKRRARLKRVIRLAIAIVLLLLMLRWFEHSQVYLPSRTLEAAPAELGRAFEDVCFKVDDGVALHGWFFPADTNSPHAQIAFLICHGNGEFVSAGKNQPCSATP